jgi:hypothetical protein
VCLTQVRKLVAHVRGLISLVRGQVSLVGHPVTVVSGPVSFVVLLVPEFFAVVLEPLTFVEVGGIDGGEGVALLRVDLLLFRVELAACRCSGFRRVDRFRQWTFRCPFNVFVHADDYSPEKSA